MCVGVCWSAHAVASNAGSNARDVCWCVLDRARRRVERRVERTQGSVVGAHALVKAGMVIPPRSLVLGAPARVVRSLSAGDEAHTRESCQKYINLTHNYVMG